LVGSGGRRSLRDRGGFYVRRRRRGKGGGAIECKRLRGVLTQLNEKKKNRKRHFPARGGKPWQLLGRAAFASGPRDTPGETTRTRGAPCLLSPVPTGGRTLRTTSPRGKKKKKSVGRQRQGGVDGRLNQDCCFRGNGHELKEVSRKTLEKRKKYRQETGKKKA